MRDSAEDYRSFVAARYTALLHTAWLLTGVTSPEDGYDTKIDVQPA